MIDYNYFTELDDKNLEKIVTHIKNIQTLRQQAFQSSFLSADIEQVSISLPTINKYKISNTFNSYIDTFENSEKHINFYLFLKTNDYTKDLDFTKIEDNICWRFANVDTLQTIKEQLPATFESFKQKTFNYSSRELIEYLHENDFMDFNLLKKSHCVTDEIIIYMLDKRMFDNIEDFPLYTWFVSMSEQTLKQVVSHFNLPPLDFAHLYDEIYGVRYSQDMKDYLKQSLKYKSPDFLENFAVTPFLVQEFSKTIDKISDRFTPLDFILKMYSLIKKEDPSLQENLINLLHSEVKKPKNQELLKKVVLNFNLNNELPVKQIKSTFNKI